MCYQRRIVASLPEYMSRQTPPTSNVGHVGGSAIAPLTKYIQLKRFKLRGRYRCFSSYSLVGAAPLVVHLLDLAAEMNTTPNLLLECADFRQACVVPCTNAE